MNHDKDIDEILDSFFGLPYPDYNMGLLPDEEGYDAVQERRNYEETYARAEAKAKLSALLRRVKVEAIQGASATSEGAKQPVNKQVANLIKPINGQLVGQMWENDQRVLFELAAKLNEVITTVNDLASERLVDSEDVTNPPSPELEAEL